MPLLCAYAGPAAVSSPIGREEGSSSAVAASWYADRRRSVNGTVLPAKRSSFRDFMRSVGETPTG